jgi:hypothetical protein
VLSRESNSGLPYSKPTHYHLSYAAPSELRRTLTLSFSRAGFFNYNRHVPSKPFLPLLFKISIIFHVKKFF